MYKVFIETVRRYELKYAGFALMFISLAIAATVSNIVGVRAISDMTQAAQTGIADTMHGFLWVLAAAYTINIAANVMTVWLLKKFNADVQYSLRNGFAARLLHMPYKEFASKTSGEGVSLFTNDLPAHANFMSTHILSQASQIITLLISVIFMLMINWWLTLIYFAMFPVFIVLQAKLAVPIGKKHMEASKYKAAYNNVVADALQNPLTVKSYGLEAVTERRFNDSYDEYYKVFIEAVKTHARLALVGVCASMSPLFVLCFAASAAVITGNMTYADFIALIIISSPVMTWLIMFSQDLARLQQAGAGGKRVLDFIRDTESPRSEQAATGKTPPDGTAVQFDNVIFGYNNETLVFQGTSFAVEKGTITALAGASGCGKSTALKLMLGLYKPDGGTCLLSSANTAYVPQDCYLLPVSIKENILSGLEYNEEKLRSACENAGIYEFIRSLPEGFDALLSESAANVSGGQKQRIAMARAFYRDAEILLLDESTAALDPVTENAVLQSFTRYIKSNGKTAVVVAHRKAVLDMADKVIML